MFRQNWNIAARRPDPAKVLTDSTKLQPILFMLADGQSAEHIAQTLDVPLAAVQRFAMRAKAVNLRRHKGAQLAQHPAA
jgi:hypothetical protein